MVVLNKSDLDFRVLVTGADGFVGRHLIAEMSKRAMSFTCATRKPRAILKQHSIGVGDIGPQTNWSKALENCHAVVHLAGRAHILREHEKEPAATFDRVNAAATKTLVRQAARHGVKRFLLMSTIAVFDPALGHLDAESETSPNTDYGRSKLLAEQFVRNAPSNMAHTILRAPLVYGPGVSARFLQLLKLAGLPFPLPFGAIKNTRSLVYVHNLVDLILHALIQPRAENQTFLVSDNQDVSTSFLLGQLAEGMGRPNLLWPMPEAFLKSGATLMGKRDLWHKFAGSLCVDCQPVRTQLDWTPPFSCEEGLKETAKWFVNRRRLHSV